MQPEKSTLLKGRMDLLVVGENRTCRYSCQQSYPRIPNPRKLEYSLRGSPGWPLIEGSGVEGTHGACRTWSPRAWSDWAEGTLEEGRWTHQWVGASG